jgi:hypothetical protein
VLHPVLVLRNKNGEVTLTQTNIFINQFTTCSGQAGQHQVILKEYRNGEALYINFNDSIKCLLAKIG